MQANVTETQDANPDAVGAENGELETEPPDNWDELFAILTERGKPGTVKRLLSKPKGS